jgi:hypothetical protein
MCKKGRTVSVGSSDWLGSFFIARHRSTPRQPKQQKRRLPMRPSGSKTSKEAEASFLLRHSGERKLHRLRTAELEPRSPTTAESHAKEPNNPPPPMQPQRESARRGRLSRDGVTVPKLSFFAQRQDEPRPLGAVGSGAWLASVSTS